jgi:hypothetical protein
MPRKEYYMPVLYTIVYGTKKAVKKNKDGEATTTHSSGTGDAPERREGAADKSRGNEAAGR